MAELRDQMSLADKLEVFTVAEPFIHELDSLLLERSAEMWLHNPADMRVRPVIEIRSPHGISVEELAEMASRHGCEIRIGRSGRQAMVQAVWPEHRYCATLVTCRRRGGQERYKGF